MTSSSSYPDGVAVIGLGYIGLPTAAALCSRGIVVKGVDVNEATVAAVSKGEVPIFEPDLDEAIERAVADGLLSATTDVPEASAYLIAVPTPFVGDHQPDLTYVRAATESIAPKLRGGELVILESTSPPGTTHQISEWLAQARPDLRLPHNSSTPDVFVAHCPERVLPGRIMVEIYENDRVVGGVTPECAERAANLYREFCTGEILLTDATTAEMAKLTENSFRDVNIAFANELDNVCRRMGLDVWEVIALANRHPRVNILNPGPGVGGHCIAVDPWFIVAAAPEEARLIHTAREVNDARPLAVVADAVARAAEAGGSVVCLGLAFKADIDDLRESPAVNITAAIARELAPATVYAVEPHIKSLPSSLAALGNIELAETRTALAAADVVVLLVDHRQFREISTEDLASKSVIDTRGLWRRVAPQD